MSVGFYYTIGFKTINNLCLYSTSNCILITYRRIKNSVLIECPFNYYIWFTGSTFVIYGKVQNTPCEEGLESAFIVDALNSKINGIQCVNELSYIIDKYKNEYEYKLYINQSECKSQNINKCNDLPACSFDVSMNQCTSDILGAFDIMNLFINRGIINPKDIQVKSYSENAQPMV